MRDWVKALPLGLGVPVVIAAASVKPEDAVSNVAAWVHFFGVYDVPKWLNSPSIDGKVIAGTAVVSVIYAFLVWGLPAIRQHTAVTRTSPRRWPPWHSEQLIPLHVAARKAYEAAEEAGVLHLHCGLNDPPEKRLDSFKLLLLLHDKTHIFGVKPPSTKSQPIPKSELIGGFDNYPMNDDQIGPAIPLNADPTYTNVTVGRRGLRIVIKEIFAEGKELPC